MRLRLDPLSPNGVSVATEQQQVKVIQSSNGYIGDTKISGLITAGSNVTLGGTGTKSDPYVINSTGGGGGGGSGIQLGVTLNRTANFTAVTNNRYSVDTTSGNITATLPATATKGDLLFIQKSDATANILYYSGTINGTVTSTFPVRLQLQAKLLEWDGASSWNVIAGDLSLPALDARYVDTTGDTMNGDLTILSDATGGEDTTDSTKRVELNSFQRAQAPREFGEVIRINADAPRSKQMIAWYKRFCTGTFTFDVTTDVFTATNNYLENGDMVVLSTTGTLPAGYSAGTTTSKGVTTGTVYYVINSNPLTNFKLSATRGGSAVDGTTVGTGTHTFTGVRTTTAWIGYHYLANDVGDPLQIHNHISIETPDSQGLLQTRFEVVADHLDQTSVGVTNANFVTTGGSNGVAAGSGAAKQFVVYTTGTGRAKTARWVLEGTAEAESTGNAGTNFKISRFDDTGTFIDNIWYIKRNTGYLGIGHNPGDPTAWIDIATSNEAPGVRILNSATGSSTQPSLYLLAGLATNRAIDLRVSTDTIGRFLMDFNGGMAWGPGTNVARDTFLNRTNFGELTTLGKFVTNTLKVGSSSVSGQLLTASDAAGNLVFNTMPDNNLLKNSQWDFDYTSWTLFGSYTTITRDASNVVNGTYSSKHVNSTAADGGILQTLTLQPGVYSFKVGAALSSGVTNAAMVVRQNISGSAGPVILQFNKAYPGNTNPQMYGGYFTLTVPTVVDILLAQGSYGATSSGTIYYSKPIVQEVSQLSPVRAMTLTPVSNVYTVDVTQTDEAIINTPAANYTVTTTSTPLDGTKFILRTVTGATPFTRTSNAIFVAGNANTLPTSYPASTTVNEVYKYDATLAKFVLLSIDLPQTFYTPMQVKAIRQVSSATTATITDGLINVSTASASVTITLPALNTWAGQVISVKKITTDTNTLTITAPSGVIEGGTASITTTATTRPSYDLISDGTNVWLK